MQPLFTRPGGLIEGTEGGSRKNGSRGDSLFLSVDAGKKSDEGH